MEFFLWTGVFKIQVLVHSNNIWIGEMLTKHPTPCVDFYF